MSIAVTTVILFVVFGVCLLYTSGFLKEQSHYIRYIHGKHFLGQVQEGAQRRNMGRSLCGR